jgi:flagellar biosynthesis chaperone FliJ
MAFRFAFASVLRLRQALERQRALALQRASLDLARAHEARAALEHFLDESERADAKSLAGGRMGAELHFALLQQQQLREQWTRLQEHILKLEALRQQAAEAYRRALRERDVLEALSAREHRTYQIEQARRQQSEMDAAFLLQHWHRRSG